MCAARFCLLSSITHSLRKHLCRQHQDPLNLSRGTRFGDLTSASGSGVPCARITPATETLGTTFRTTTRAAGPTVGERTVWLESAMTARSYASPLLCRVSKARRCCVGRTHCFLPTGLWRGGIRNWTAARFNWFCVFVALFLGQRRRGDTRYSRVASHSNPLTTVHVRPPSARVILEGL